MTTKAGKILESFGRITALRKGIIKESLDFGKDDGKWYVYEGNKQIDGPFETEQEAKDSKNKLNTKDSSESFKKSKICEEDNEVKIANLKLQIAKLEDQIKDLEKPNTQAAD
jgi:polyhydroxyalkanoate synthesis regulator phasin